MITRGRTYLLLALAALAVAVLVLPAPAAPAHAAPLDVLVAGHGASGPLLSAALGGRMLAAAMHAALAQLPPAHAPSDAAAPRYERTERISSFHSPFLDRLRI